MEGRGGGNGGEVRGGVWREERGGDGGEGGEGRGWWGVEGMKGIEKGRRKRGRTKVPAKPARIRKSAHRRCLNVWCARCPRNLLHFNFDRKWSFHQPKVGKMLSISKTCSAHDQRMRA